MTWYRTGTVAVTNGSATVTGSGTAFVANVQAGEGIVLPDNRSYEIASVNSDTSLTLASAYLGATAGGQTYAILPTQSFAHDLALLAVQLLTDFGDVRDGPGEGLWPDGSAATPAFRFSADQDTGFYRPAANVIAWATNGVERGRLDASGNLGIGHANPLARLHVNTSGANASHTLVGNDSGLIKVGTAADGTAQVLAYAGEALTFGNDNLSGSQVEWGRFSTTGNLGIGTTAPALTLHVRGLTAATGQAQIIAEGEPGGYGAGLSFRSQVAGGGALVEMARITADGEAAWTGTASTQDAGLNFYTCLDGVITKQWLIFSNGTLAPATDNTTSFCSASLRCSVVYSATGAINTSDERAKQQIGAIPDDLLDAWSAVEWCRSKFNEAVDAKGDDARWHFGARAQQVRDAIDAALGEGSAVRLGLYCYDEWDAIAPVAAVKEVRDKKGNVTVAAQPARPGRKAGNIWGLRYDECQAIEAAYQRRRMDRIEARLTALETA